ncbi:MAG: hypothetical protein LBF42_00145 [Puniceicoccales bacterium]|nr:hypothetical protein [Puniceicoccales bacterium]
MGISSLKRHRKSRYEQISEEERQLLKHIVVRAKILKDELAQLERISNPTSEVSEQIISLKVALASIDSTVRDHGGDVRVGFRKLY